MAADVEGGKLVPSRRRISFALPLAALALLAVTGCGDGDARTSAVTDVETVTTTVTTPGTTTPTTTTTTPGTTTPAPSSPPNPDAPLSLQTAEQTLDTRGFATLTERDFQPGQPLKVLIGVRRGGGGGGSGSGGAGAGDEGDQQAFFFYGDRYIGTDTKLPSGRVAVSGQQGDAITLTYGLYAPGDAIDAPSAGSADVTYRWTGTALEPQGEIPSADPAASPSRR